jgi:hypothetical protein
VNPIRGARDGGIRARPRRIFAIAATDVQVGGFVRTREIPYYIDMSIEDLKKAVAGLPPDQYAQFRAWFDAFDADRFDRKIERDAQAGKLDRLADAAIDDLRKGRAKASDPVALFSEWSSGADEKAYRDL